MLLFLLYKLLYKHELENTQQEVLSSVAVMRRVRYPLHMMYTLVYKAKSPKL